MFLKLVSGTSTQLFNRKRNLGIIYEPSVLTSDISILAYRTGSASQVSPENTLTVYHYFHFRPVYFCLSPRLPPTPTGAWASVLSLLQTPLEYNIYVALR